MNLFERLVEQALQTQPECASVRAVVEKELLHHDILREMSAAGLLAGLTFVGGTCLRACYGSSRLSEDLDFTGGADFTRARLAALGRVLVDKLAAKYALPVTVAEPVKETAGVDTWKLTLVTHPASKHLPAQRIHIDICAIPSQDRRPMMLRTVYGIDLGTAGLIIQAQSREEILADKVIALAFRPNRLKNRDLWDIAWLKQQGVELPVALLGQKLADRRRGAKEFASLLRTRTNQLQHEPAMRADFVKEIQRFLPAAVVAATAAKADYWRYLTDLVRAETARAIGAVSGQPPARGHSDNSQ